MEKFERGNVVELNSGGPHMSVGECDGEKIALVWFDDVNRTFEDLVVEQSDAIMFRLIVAN